MKKLLALVILSTVSSAAPCFGVDFIKDRIYVLPHHIVLVALVML